MGGTVSNKRKLSISVHERIDKAIRDHAEIYGITVSQVIEEALIKHLDLRCPTCGGIHNKPDL